MRIPRRRLFRTVSPTIRVEASDAQSQRRRYSRRPLYCPICQSPRIKVIARLRGGIACCCEACNAELLLSPQSEHPL